MKNAFAVLCLATWWLVGYLVTYPDPARSSVLLFVDVRFAYCACTEYCDFRAGAAEMSSAAMARFAAPRITSPPKHHAQMAFLWFLAWFSVCFPMACSSFPWFRVDSHGEPRWFCSFARLACQAGGAGGGGGGCGRGAGQRRQRLPRGPGGDVR